MRRLRCFVAATGLVVGLSISSVGVAQVAKSAAAPGPAALGAVMPVFSQIVSFQTPPDFVPVYTNTRNGQYIQEWVLRGENVNHWTQMLTITGIKDFGINQPDVTPKVFAAHMAKGYQQACPSSYAVKEIYEGKITTRDGFVMAVGCGNAPTSDGHSETAVIAVVKGDRDIYTLQWAERATPTPAPVNIDVNLWSGRLGRLMPLKLCPIVPGEAAPYPSCVGQ